MPPFFCLSAQRSRFEKGFSLMELILVLGIIGVLSLVLISRARVVPAVRLSSAVDRVISDMRFTQRLSVTRHAIYGVFFDIPADLYYVFEGDDTTDQISNPHDLGPFVNQLNQGIFKNVRIDSASFDGSQIVKFNVFGEPLMGDTNDTMVVLGEVVLSNGISTRTIFIEPGTGHIHN